ncbi:Adenylate kinase [Thermanaeromonas toyohensis ToBE]|uniref:Adenylate kinase n=1 Tax=Thermanaeromonas toyohensis ToBE TaxID=698762 RepID=A0A1W1V6G0_9FIRM|nr:adenylate kinase [Thermanaeromonas toyohensis]SMB88922.1 Adenylate kinase [Thermanaeromonas toyohensis ToBE]
MRLVLLGPPGAGKGTQAQEISRRLEIPHISTGDMFRAAIRSGTELGRKAKEYLEAGLLVPDEVTIGLVKDRLSRRDCEGGFLLDGFPRTVPQAQALDDWLAERALKLDAVLDIEAPREVLLIRLTGRRICPACGATYHVVYNPPQQPGRCDACGGELIQRQDDREETVRERLEVYDRQTFPLKEYYRQRGVLYEINGNQEIVQVLKEIGAVLGREWA